MLSVEQKDKVASSLRLAAGLMQTVAIASSSSEYEIRNAISRLYYAFFHASVALLVSIGWETQGISKDHGKIHAAVQARMGKYMGTFLRKLYQNRKLCDYDSSMFERSYGRDLAKARRDVILDIKRAKTNFHWIYQEARKVL